MAKVQAPSISETAHRIQLPREWRGQRLDRALGRLFADHSRGEIQDWIGAGRVLVEGEPASVRSRLKGNEWITVDPPAPGTSPDRGWTAAPVPLTVRYCDEALIVLGKEPGRVVHPAPGHREDTLANGLLYRFPELTEVERAGIVHRLDRDTSGLLAVARTGQAREALVRQFKAHSVQRRYLALVHGELTSGSSVDAPIARHPRHRTRFAVVADGKPAVTHYRVRQRFPGLTLVEAWLETGRTHQARIHMAHIGHPVVGDPLYGGKGGLPRGIRGSLRERLRAFPRQALHADRLTLDHPITGDRRAWEETMPEDLADLVRSLSEASP